MSAYEKLIRPLMFSLDAERAHEIGIETLRVGLATSAARDVASRRYVVSFPEPIELFGLKFANPLGVAAGFDKNGIVVDQLAALGFGFVEVGTVTYKPQKGNEKPRLFRLPDDGALINRLGFNNDGAEAVVERLGKIERRCVVGVNIGRNKDVPNEEAVENYLASFDLIHDAADYIAVNISSPNTPGLRDLQRGESLEELLGAIQARNSVPEARRLPAEAATQSRKPLLVKIAPDLSEAEIEMMVDTCLRFEIDGIIATNTTVSRDGLRTSGVDRYGAGGLSGRPLRSRSTQVIETVYRHSNGRIPIVGVGGVFTAEDAFEKIAAGASLVQAYTGFVYGGPSFARTLNGGLIRILRERGFSSVDAAVGSGISTRIV